MSLGTAGTVVMVGLNLLWVAPVLWAVGNRLFETKVGGKAFWLIAVVAAYGVTALMDNPSDDIECRDYGRVSSC